VLEALDKPKLNEQDVEHAAWHIARVDFTYPYFKPFIDPVVADFKKRRFIKDPGPISEAMQALGAFDGRTYAGSMGAEVYLAFLDALQEEIFLSTTGNFISMDNFRQAAQPSVMLAALQRKTKVNYLGSRSAAEVVETAIGKAGERLAQKYGRDLGTWRYTPGLIRWGDEPPVPYSNRGTMIQVIDLATMSGRNIVPPGVAESGPHAFDQVPLARAWVLKAMISRP
jgi:penicillin amidase